MAQSIGYAQAMRAIGQALEVLNIQGFEMDVFGDDFVVRGNVSQPDNRIDNSVNPENLKAVWGETLSGAGAAQEIEERSAPGTFSRIELRYTAQDIERLEEEGKARRGTSQKPADAASVSQVLRCIGGYLNQKRASLCKLTHEAGTAVVEYETSLGSKMQESLSAADLYNLWVRMYMQRAERTAQ